MVDFEDSEAVCYFLNLKLNLYSCRLRISFTFSNLSILKIGSVFALYLLRLRILTIFFCNFTILSHW